MLPKGMVNTPPVAGVLAANWNPAMSPAGNEKRREGY